MLGYLLARAGIDVVVLEKHGDFLRDFRGDTIHPSTLEVLDQIGLATRFLELPHSEVSTVMGRTAAGQTVTFSLKRLPSRYRFIAFVPQWDFLEFITREAANYPTFRLLRHAEAVGLIERDGTIRGVRYRSEGAERQIEALLTVGADGRASLTRQAAGLPMIETSPAMDVLWFRLPRHRDEPVAVAGRLGPGRVLVMINRGQYWQIAYVIAKGTADWVRASGLEAFRAEVARVAPDLADRVGDIRSWDEVKLLTVRSDRLRRWHRPGYLAIGDAAHAMSPIGGLGINVAIQDAVAAANLLWRPLAGGNVSDADLDRVQRSRELPVKIMQSVQAFVQNRFLKPTLDGSRPPTIPLGARIVARVPLLRDLPGRLIGLGIRRPRVESPDVFAAIASARPRPGSAS
jgi:2-polyprenyl-6-methoxyphenol hydroxylase-like FAD-dependent oxidoreductase